MNDTFVIYGNFIDTPSPDTFRIQSKKYLVVENGVIAGIYQTLPKRFEGFELLSYEDALIIPGLIDLHVHAPQFGLMGTHMDMELIPWLQTYVFPEEAKFGDTQYAQKLYPQFVAALKKSPTTRACIFGTLHTEATLYLMDLLERSGLITCVGKVNMDQNSEEYLQEETDESLEQTIAFIEEAHKKFSNTKPIITPRFAPVCSSNLLKQLGFLAEKYDIPVQSHLSENTAEIEWVAELFPYASCYGDVYYQAHLFGNNQKTIMAHAVHCSDIELDLLANNDVYVAHCASSNTNLSSGIAPVKKMIEQGIKVGLGTDVAGGSSLSMFRAVSDAVQVSKLLSVYGNSRSTNAQITFANAFFCATNTGGSFFGSVGLFEDGYDFDALVLQDVGMPFEIAESLATRLERIFYLGDDENICAKFVRGARL